MHSCLLVGLPLLLATLVPAQAPPPAGASTESSEAVHLALADAAPDAVAWGAVRAGQAGRTDAVPALRAALRRFADAPDEPARYCRLALADALVQLGATLPLAELTRHDDDLLRPALLVLAARDLPSNLPYVEARFAATENAPDLEWRVCGNLLAAERRSAFAVRCLQGIEFHLIVRIFDDKPRSGSCSQCRSGGDDRSPVPPGFPRLHIVQLDAANATSRGDGLRVVAFARQQLRHPSQLAIETCDPQRAFRDWLVGYGAARTAAACDLELRTQWREVRWRSAQQLRKTLARERERVERLCAAMAKELVAAGVVPAEAIAGLRPRFEVELIDCRGEAGRLPLPRPEALLAR
jgi:hypothetical protein